MTWLLNHGRLEQIRPAACITARQAARQPTPRWARGRPARRPKYLITTSRQLSEADYTTLKTRFQAATGHPVVLRDNLTHWDGIELEPYAPPLAVGDSRRTQRQIDRGQDTRGTILIECGAGVEDTLAFVAFATNPPAHPHRSWWRRLLHIHHDPDWHLVGAHRYEQCRCGARRTTRAYTSLDGPTAHDWPIGRDQHGVWRDSSGWRHGDWTTTGYPTAGSHASNSEAPPEDYNG